MSEYIIDWDENLVIDTFSKNNLREEIVRCRDCQYNARDVDGICYRFDHEHFNQPDDYCSWAVRRDEWPTTS